MTNISRRAVFKTGAILAMGASTMSANTSARTSETLAAPTAASPSTEYSYGHTTDFGDEYFANILPILEKVRDNELAVIDEVSSRMADAVRSGKNVWMQAKQGHMGRFEFDMGNPGNPRLFQSNSEWDDTDYDKMKPGDVLVTNYINDNVMNARTSGVCVVGVTVSYQDTPAAPRGLINPNPHGWFLADVSDVVIDSHSPIEQGIVSCPQIPEMKICPSSANPLAAIFWMLTAEGANKFKNPSASGTVYAAEVIDTIIGRVRAAFPPQRDRIFAAADSVAAMIASGARYHVTSDHGGVAQEAAGVASGPMMTNAFRKEVKKGDVHLLATIEPDSPKILDEAQRARDVGQFVVSIGPANSARLAALSDLFIDNLSREGGGLLQIPGFPEKIAAVGGILNNVLMWIFTAQFVDFMTRRGFVPWFWMGYYLQGGKEYDDAVKPFFLRQGF